MGNRFYLNTWPRHPEEHQRLLHPKDLKSFLLQELDFFIKNECFSWTSSLLATNKIWTATCAERVVRDISKIIDFLAQVEDFQKKLWEKRSSSFARVLAT